MSRAQAARLAKIEVDLLALQERVSLQIAPDYGKLAAKLAAERETDAALQLIRVLFDVVPERERSAPALREPRGRLQWHEYEHVFQPVLPKLAETIPDHGIVGTVCESVPFVPKGLAFTV